ncbi:MAG: hypothetical protein AAF554_14200 [Bacteroidota bacterium]
MKVEFVTKAFFSDQKVLHPKYASEGTNFIVKDKRSRRVAFDFSKIGSENTNIVVEKNFDLNTLGDILFDLVKIILLGKKTACIHASSYVAPGGAVIISGWEGVGKSALMLKKVYQGDSFLSDDRTFVSNKGYVFPIYSDIKQYSGEFASFTELLGRSNLKERFIIRLNIFLNGIRKKNKSPRIYYGVQKILNLLRRLNLYKIHIPLDKIPIAKNEGYVLSKVLVLQQIADRSELHLEGDDHTSTITSLINTTKFDDSRIFRLYQAYKYLFPEKRNSILEQYEQNIEHVLSKAFENVKVSQQSIYLEESIAAISKRLNA